MCLLVNGRQIVVGVHGPGAGAHVREAAAGSVRGPVRARYAADGTVRYRRMRPSSVAVATAAVRDSTPSLA
ncbi:hypothetical protein SAMN05192584_12135 [Streptomyces pini]|uniref:Uncharacterized protein n=1 Tax=Streptomyces pini TaxID=1520580 RepID=A0A1I4IL73_9ACTN|nr:hypothetical protein SAMN05192584_12135 [Streptomyces pini]